MTILAYQHFLQQASQRLRDEYQLGRRNAVLIINFERLIELDGILGFTIVDNTLQQIAQQLRNALNPDDLVGITGRYQICCLLVDLLTDAHAMLAAHKILRILTPPFVLDRKNIILAPRLGVAVNNASGDKLDQLMCNASAAVRQAKLEQLPSKLFHAEMQDPLLFQIDLWSDLGNAIENGGLYLGYQPQIDIASGKIKSTEALLRWHHPHHGPIRTDKLIQVAEGTPLMSKLTLWVFHTALRECSEYRKAGLNAGVSINFSADDLRDPELTELVLQGLSLWNVPPEDITIELTETAVMDNQAGTLDTLCQLKDMGLKLAMDDFGTGYSSMARMLDLPLDEVKIDMVFVKHMTTHHKHDRIVDSMINLAHRLNLSVVAEGVEDVATYERLRALGCDVIQGYLIGKAMPLPELIKTVNDQFPAHCFLTASQIIA
ncbi:EAL domain, c-di-GMP-specific phosphodiesterase class I (or its enzymatically inactive variant) [Nitrosomonas ureae]|uniref:EAL domain, c-di-GMP-specific phosphodiesterase class I (Or its enzymatically inactive variant) n=1 Tax=Nitrosomonas ureae TaxID=44577 RepID=A0A285C0E2_9PROT|nr:GGDEF domain-containing phosphodiesterase [Nitrosomonas ureae]SNX61047.1 EAL domain, c-di-GMP-specific phosphodiesterase class I (or its enzymatically inactive variant) [Nitrosomonas ureae]